MLIWIQDKTKHYSIFHEDGLLHLRASEWLSKFAISSSSPLILRLSRGLHRVRSTSLPAVLGNRTLHINLRSFVGHSLACGWEQMGGEV